MKVQLSTSIEYEIALSFENFIEERSMKKSKGLEYILKEYLTEKGYYNEKEN